MNIQAFQRKIYTYYHKHKRDLPWRRTHDPYKILVSEIMLQQTQVARVITKYNEFIERFPSFSALAESSLRDVLTLWQGLGYNRRAIMLYRLAKTIKNTSLPQNFIKLQQLPGIGQSTAGAIMAFAFNKPVVFIETNIRSVFIYYFFKNHNLIHDKEIVPLIAKTLDRKNPRQWYYALMDYGVMLKKQYPNPSRNSQHYTKQSKFEGSNRQMRGAIIKILATHSKLPAIDIAQTVGTDPNGLSKILNQLSKEGLITHSDDLWSIV